MTSAEIRQSFLDFFKSRQHSIVPSSSLMPQSPGLLFTNAGMNPFVPYFLGTEKAPYHPPRAADTQKCIRAGGKHNDLEDVGYDTYHHTFFEMLGNWSFGDYFKKEAIEWSWALIVETWGVPANRLYATVYAPSESDPSEFDQESHDIWAKLFRGANLDPGVHIINGGVKDNFWMMGETGPCGPCSELHVDLTPKGDSQGKLVNIDSDLCIEIWNLVFIQYNAEADGSFRDLPARHVDTGMGFERICSLIQNTRGFTDFSRKPSNYATDVFQPIFRKLEELSGKKYEDIYPDSRRLAPHSSLAEAIAFRVIADHLRTLSFSLADGILPGNTGRNYVLRRILRRAVRYGRALGFNGSEPFLAELVDTLVAEFGEVFPELNERASAIKEALTLEENNFNRTLDRGLRRLDAAMSEHTENWNAAKTSDSILASSYARNQLPGIYIFELYDTYGFPKDLTDLILQERGWTSDTDGFEQEMNLQRKRAREARSQQLVRAAGIASDASATFTGFETDESVATVLELHTQDDALLVITDRTPFYAEMGGQLGDQGKLTVNGADYPVTAVQQLGAARAHTVTAEAQIAVGDEVTLSIDPPRRRSIEAHHTATHLLHWALREVVSKDAAQQGSLVSHTRLRFDFNSGPLSPEQIDALEHKVNARIEADDPVSWREAPYAEVKNRKDIQQFFGDKYGDQVRVVQIGGQPDELDGYSMELCGGAHTRNTSAIGLFKIKSEGAIASGIRRIEAVCGRCAREWMRNNIQKAAEEEKELRERLNALNEKLKALDAAPVDFPELPQIVMGSLLNPGNFKQKNAIYNDRLRHIQSLKVAAIEADKALKKAQTAGAAKIAKTLLADLDLSSNLALATEGPAPLLQELLNALKSRQFAKAAFCIVNDGDKLHLGALVGGASDQNAGKLIKELAPIAGGKGGGRPDIARGAATDLDKAEELETAARKVLS